MGGILRPLARVVSAPLVLPFAVAYSLGKATVNAFRPEEELPEMAAPMVVDIEPNGTVWKRHLNSVERADRIRYAHGQLSNFTLFPGTRKIIEEIRQRSRR